MRKRYHNLLMFLLGCSFRNTLPWVRWSNATATDTDTLAVFAFCIARFVATSKKTASAPSLNFARKLGRRTRVIIWVLGVQRSLLIGQEIIISQLFDVCLSFDYFALRILFALSTRVENWCTRF